MKSGVVSKIRVFNPNKSKTAISNKEYCNYIATRPGVDLTNIKAPDFNIDFNNIDMIDNVGYTEYIENRPRSHGLFGNFDFDNLSDVTSEINSLSKQGKLIYRGITSLTEDDAKDLGYLDKNKWKILLDSTMPDIAKVFGISILNLNWVAAFHYEEEHPHVHYLFWDTSNRIVSPFIHVSKQNKCREIFSTEIFKDERVQQIIEKTANRDSILESSKSLINDSFSKLSELFTEDMNNVNIADKIYSSEVDSVSLKLLDLVLTLPEHGRIAYAYMPTEIKNKVNLISKEIFSRKDIQRNLSAYTENANILGNTISMSNEKHDVSISKAYIDLQKRVGNIILKSAQNLRGNLIEQDIKNSSILTNFLSNNFNLESVYFNSNMEENIEPSENNATNYPYEYVSQNDFISFKNFSKENFFTKDFKLARSLLYPKDKTIDSDYARALEILLKESIKNPLAAFELGNIYYKGLGVEQDFQTSDLYYRKSLSLFLDYENRNHSAYLQYRIGKMYLYGQGTQKNSTKAREWLTKAANQNYQFAQSTLAGLYKSGNSVEQNFEKAFSLYNQSCIGKCDMPYSHFEIAKMYSSGVGVSIDKDKAYKHYEKSLDYFLRMDKKNPDDMIKYKIGSMYYNALGCNKDLDLAYNYFSESAKLNNQFAEYSLGKIHLDKDTKYYNSEMAIKFLTNSIKHGNILASYSLGILYNDKNSIYYDLDKAIYYLTMASDSNNHFAQYALGKMYMNKESSLYDFNKSLTFFIKSANQNNQYAQYALGKIYLDNSTSVYDIKKAIDFLSMSAEQGNEYAQYALGKIYMDKDSNICDLDLSINYLSLAANQGNQYAQYELGKIYSDNSTKYYNLDKAFKFFYDSIEQDNDLARYSMAKILLDKNTSYYDVSKAIELLTKAAESENSFAQLELAKLYYFGTHISRNKETSLYWLNKSISNNNQYAKEFLNFQNRLSWANIYSTSYKLIVSIFNESNKDRGKDQSQDHLQALSKLKKKHHKNHKHNTNEDSTF